MTKVSYINENGDTVFTSEYYRKKGSCCKSSCLHCPFGHTIRTIGLKIEDVDSNNLTEAKDLYQKLVRKDNFTSSLLDSAFKPKTESSFDTKRFKILTLKSFTCGLLELKKGKYQKHYLIDVFSDQGIDEAYLSSLL